MRLLHVGLMWINLDAVARKPTNRLTSRGTVTLSRNMQQRPAAGSYQPKSYLADFSYWAKMPNWTDREAIAVLLGVNPHFVDEREEYLQGDAGQYEDQYFGLLRSARRAIEFDQIGTQLRPADWIEWAHRFQYPVPESLASEIDKWGAQSTNETIIADLKAKVIALKNKNRPSGVAQPKNETNALNPRERDMMLRIIIAMAVRKYRYRPELGRNDATQSIFSDVEAVGLQTSPETVLKYLREGATLLPAEGL